MEIVTANHNHLAQLARLFDQYRQFYQCQADIPLAESFIEERLTNGDSVIFVAEHPAGLVGFVQLYPSFCSVDACRIFILYDLFVGSDQRSLGIGAQLMNRATDYAREKGAARIDLLTGKDNFAGQHLYQKLGYQRSNEDFYSYSLTV